MIVDDKKNIQANIGRACKAYRLKVGLTQAKLAETVGVHIRSIQNFENGMGGQINILLIYVMLGFDLNRFCDELKRMVKNGEI